MRTMKDQIKHYRKAAGLTQEQVANYLGVSTPAVNKWERGSSCPDIALLAPLARLLKTDVDTLLSFHEELTMQEIDRLVREVQTLVKREGLEAGYARSQELVLEHPCCDLLIVCLAQILDVEISMEPGTVAIRERRGKDAAKGRKDTRSEAESEMQEGSQKDIQPEAESEMQEGSQKDIQPEAEFEMQKGEWENPQSETEPVMPKCVQEEVQPETKPGIQEYGRKNVQSEAEPVRSRGEGKNVQNEAESGSQESDQEDMQADRTAEISAKVLQWYKLVADGKDARSAELAKVNLVTHCRRAGDYEGAQRLLDEVPLHGLDKRPLQAALYMEQGKTEEACKVYEGVILESGTQITSALQLLIENKLRTGRREEAEELAKLHGELADLLELGAYIKNAPEYFLGVSTQDKDRTLCALRAMFENILSLAARSNKETKLYPHLKGSDPSRSPEIAESIRAMMLRGLEQDEELAFLRGDLRFQHFLDLVRRSEA